MNEDELFKLYRKLEKRSEYIVDNSCDHSRVVGNVCDICFEILWKEEVSEDSYSRTTRRGGGYEVKCKIDRFHKGYCVALCLCDDYKLFLKAYERIDKKRKNSLMNKFVAWKLLERRGVVCEGYVIKSEKSRCEHEELCREVFNLCGWS